MYHCATEFDRDIYRIYRVEEVEEESLHCVYLSM